MNKKVSEPEISGVDSTLEIPDSKQFFEQNGGSRLKPEPKEALCRSSLHVRFRRICLFHVNFIELHHRLN